MHSAVRLAVLRAADVLQLQSQLGVPALQSADVIAQDALRFLFRLRLLAGAVGQVQGDVVLRKVRVHQSGQLLLRVLLVQLLLYFAGGLAPCSPLPRRLEYRVYVSVHVIAADIYALPVEGSPCVHARSSFPVAKLRLVTSLNSRVRARIVYSVWGPPRESSEAILVGRGGAAQRMSFPACGEANDSQLAPTRSAIVSAGRPSPADRTCLRPACPVPFLLHRTDRTQRVLFRLCG